LPAGPGQTLELPIQALQPGSQGNLPAGNILAIEGALGVDLTVTNPKPTTGGSDLASPAPTPLDQSRLRNQLEAALEQSALQEIQSSLKPGDLLLVDHPGQVQTLEMIFDPPESQPASLLNLRLRLEYQVPIVRASDLNALVTSILDANLPPGYSPLTGSLQIDHLTSPARDDASNYQWPLKAQRHISAHVEDEQVAQIAVGLAPAQARQRLIEALPLAEPPTFTLFPSWWPRLPFLPFRISITSES
jgi:hypothetical protein